MTYDMGKKIHLQRSALNMTLAELGSKVGVGASTVRKWETGYIKNIQSDKIQKLADALEVSPAYLMGWDSPERNQPKYKSLGRLEEMGPLSQEEDEEIAKYIAYVKSQREK